MIYLLSPIVYFNFSVQKLAKFLSNSGKVNFEGLVHLLIYIRYNKTLVLKYYADMKVLSLSDLLRQANISTKNQLTVFSCYSWKYFLYTGRITGAYIIFYQGGPIDHVTHVTGPVSQSSVESEYSAACTAEMALAHFRMLIHGF